MKRLLGFILTRLLLLAFSAAKSQDNYRLWNRKVGPYVCGTEKPELR
jgi:hypothetical protein